MPYSANHNFNCESTFIHRVPILVVFVDGYIHKFKWPTNCCSLVDIERSPFRFDYMDTDIESIEYIE